MIIGVLDNLRSIHNVGTIFRTADALGIDELRLCGQTATPHPDEPWRADHLRLTKTALGAEKSVAWKYVSNTIDEIAQLKKDGFTIISLELTDSSLPLATWIPSDKPLAIVVGNEVTGVDPQVLTASDMVLHIPMLGKKESLNVAVAFGIAAYSLRQK